MAATDADTQTSGRAANGSRRLTIAVIGLLLVAGALAVTSLVGDSITFDETFHLTAGTSYWQTGDFRLASATPPLAQLWATWPLVWMDAHWPTSEDDAWRQGDTWRVGRNWLRQLPHADRVVIVARCMVVILLLATCACIYAVARSAFGPAAGLLALALAAFSPTLLAHGRLVTADLPATLCFIATLLTFARLMNRVTWLRLAAAAVSLACLCLVKFSWPVILPVLGVMAVVAVARGLPQWPRTTARADAAGHGRPRAVGTACGILLCMGLVAWLAVWTCFCWRYSPFRNGESAGTMLATAAAGRTATATMDDVWRAVLQDDDGQPAGGVVIGFIRWARRHHLLPEAYLYGWAYAERTTAGRAAYLNGEISTTGWRRYFPYVFAVKTPIATMVLMIGGLVAMLRRRLWSARNPVLVAGLGAFLVVYGGLAMSSAFNVGHRHILPVYPVLLAVAGASAVWWQRRFGRWAIGALVAWLVIANLWVHPHYLSYFNEPAGGPASGYRHLADSNIDWGQDLKRLAAYARLHSDETIKLAYFGSVDPAMYDLDCEELPSFFSFGGRPADLTAGTYVVSVTQLLGVYAPMARDSFWRDPGHLQTFRQLEEITSVQLPDDAPEDVHRRQAFNTTTYWNARRGLLLNRLAKVPPDDRIGCSLFIYHLDQEQVARFSTP